MKRILTVCVALSMLMIYVSCEKGETRMQREDRSRLEKMRQEILDKITGIPCTDPEEWSFSALGSKACGGPQEYIVYPLSIDTEEFLTLVEQYTKAEDEYNRKYNVISNCMAILAPSDVECEDGKPKLIYDELK